MNKRSSTHGAISILLVSVLLLGLLPFFPFWPTSIAEGDPDPIDYADLADDRAKVSATYARGNCWSVTALGEGQFAWRSEDPWVYSSSESKFVPYIASTSGDCYTVQSGLIAAELYRNKAVFFSPEMDRQAVGRETWLVFQRVGDEWNPVCASLTSYFQSQSMSSDETTVNVTGTWATAKGTLEVVYSFKEHLKHSVTWTPNQAGAYAIVQFWNETVYDSVKLGDGTVINRRTDDYTLGSSESICFLFYNESQPFGVFEDQSSAMDMLHKVFFAKGTITYEGITITDGVAWVFYNASHSVVGAGVPIIIDPDTYSSTNPTKDGVIWYSPGYYYPQWAATGFMIGDLGGSFKRAIFEWDISSISDSAVITLVNHTVRFGAESGECELDVYGFQEMQPSTVSGSFPDTPISVDWWTECKNGSIFYEGGAGFPNNAWYNVTLNSDGISYVSGCLSRNWFALAYSEEVFNDGDKNIVIYQEESGSYYSTITIIYTVNSAPVNDACDSDSTFDVGVDGWVNVTVYDENGGYLDLETVEINVTTSSSEVFILRWTNDTAVFTELSDSNGVCTLDATDSTRTNVNASADKFCFNFQVNAAPAKGACTVNATSVDAETASDSDVYSSEFSINFYLGITINDGSHSWSSMNPGSTDQALGDDGDIDVTVDANANFDLEAKGSGALASGGNSIALSSVEMHETTLGSAIALTTGYQDIPGLTDETRGTSQAKAFKLWISIPNPQQDGTYTYTLSVKGTEH